MKRLILTSLLCLFISGITFSQAYEGYMFEIAARVKIYLPANDVAQLEGNDRYIQAGILGYQKDIDDLVGYMDRFAINDKDMITEVMLTNNTDGVHYYKFYLDPLYDANNFQFMLEHFKIEKYFVGAEEKPVSGFSNFIYASIKSKK
jgi:hypothetical protein